MRKTQSRSLGRKDPLEKEMATHSSTLAWKSPWIEDPRRLQSMGSQRDTIERLHFHFSLSSCWSCPELSRSMSEEHGGRTTVGGEELPGWLLTLSSRPFTHTPHLPFIPERKISLRSLYRSGNLWQKR